MLENQTLFVGDEQMKIMVNSKSKNVYRANSHHKLKQYPEFEFFSL